MLKIIYDPNVRHKDGYPILTIVPVEHLAHDIWKHAEDKLCTLDFPFDSTERSRYLHKHYLGPNLDLIFDPDM
jgi:hypothetical protein